jgi:hypothetical protein
MTQPLHRDVEALLRSYARDLDTLSPSKSLDARIDALVAGPARKIPRARLAVGKWALAAAIGTVAVALGVFIGVRIERAASPKVAGGPQGASPGVAGGALGNGAEPTWPPPDVALWPTDSVALKIPAEVSASGTLVAVDGKSKAESTRYWVDIVVSNDGTIRIENIVPAGESPGEKHGVAIQNP